MSSYTAVPLRSLACGPLSSLLATLFEGAQQGSRIAIIEVHEPRTTFFTLVAPVAALLSVASSDAQAASIIRNRTRPSTRSIEPKLNLGFVGLWDYGGNSYGPGVRFSIPVMSPGFVKTINDSVAITFGADFVYYEGYRYYNRTRGGNRACYDYYADTTAASGRCSSCRAAVELLPHRQVERLRRGRPDGPPRVLPRRSIRQHVLRRALLRLQPEPLNVWGTFYGGGRFHFNEKIALTMRNRLPDRGLGRRVVLPISRQSTVDSRQSCLLTVDC